MTTRLTLHKIDGAEYVCEDIGCPDLEAAQRNRERIANPPQEELDWWHWYERVVQTTPQNKPLPPGAPQ